MAWIESHQTLRNHPKLKKLCRTLRMSHAGAIGRLHMLWWWVLEYRMDGVLTDLNDAEIADAAEYPGDPKRFVNALVDAKFLDRGKGVLTVHDWLDFCGEVVRKRLQRLADKRQKTADIGGHSPPNRPQQNQPDLTVPGQTSPVVDLVERLVALGLTKLNAAGIVNEHGIDRVNVVAVAALKAKKPAGFVIDALRKGWQV